MTQKKLAALTGMHRGTLSLIERGLLWPPRGWRFRLAEALQLPEEQLFAREGR
jgi:transcriptional regulator with XRE-family HTH domain